MSFIDLSDAEGMFGLFVDLVADARAECQGNPDRLDFLEGLLAELKAMESHLDQAPLSATVQKLEELHQSVDRGLANDPVMRHLEDLIGELERVGGI